MNKTRPRRSAIAGLILVATLVAGAAWAEEPVILNQAYCDRWPDASQQRFARKKAGVREGVAGKVRLLCDLAHNTLRNCQVVTETPTDNHFGEAAKLLAPRFECGVKDTSGRPHKVDLSFTFDRLLPDEHWNAHFPNFHELQLVYPPAAAKAGVNGAAVVECGVAPEGLAEHCKVIAEAPAGYGFGSATLLVVPGFRTDKPMRDSRPIADMTIRLGVKFNALGALSKEETEPVAPVVYWASAPTRADVAAAFPSTERAAGLTGRVLYRCGFKSDGLLDNCTFIDVKATDPDFTAATRALLPRFRMAVETVEPDMLAKMKVNLVIWIRQDDPARSRVIAEPEWIRTVSGDKAQQVFPPKAADAGLTTGRATLDCIADARGMMTACKVAGEDPGGMDFGPAALRVATVMGINPWTNDGEPVEGAHVIFAIRLNQKE